MHKCISDAANKCIGIDINEAGIDLLKEKYAYQNVYYNDLLNQNLLPEIISSSWDIIFLGEILEHVNNPVLFLQSIHQKYGPYIKSIVITVPNAFRSENFIGAIKNREVINSDHRYWFTPYTLSKILVLAGFKNPKLSLVSSMPITDRGPLHRFLLRKKPMFRDTLLVEACFFD
ncbi:Methyltransferase domain-containing protein [Williamwhitmania taraxaci]|uniref:Methyltransferase domain-containing protein n=2 Tax=Williamwhitmania taraxaci TaxID=1640674 RepID=A0A1G6PDV3_9BACT|nr:Methyltransferase domain-containing protein [Williamwhitmania taraxaci]